MVLVVAGLMLQGCATIVSLDLSTRLDEIYLTSSVVSIEAQGDSVSVTVPLTVAAKDPDGMILAMTYGDVKRVESWTRTRPNVYDYEFVMKAPVKVSWKKENFTLRFKLWTMDPDTEKAFEVADVSASVQQFNYAKRSAVSFAILSFVFWATR